MKLMTVEPGLSAPSHGLSARRRTLLNIFRLLNGGPVALMMPSRGGVMVPAKGGLLETTADGDLPTRICAMGTELGIR